MKPTIRQFIASLLLIAACVPAARADFNDGVVAYLMGDYQTAYNTMRSLAETADHAYAQYYVAMMYLNGQGVTQSYEEAANWFRKSAEHGVPQAQYKLGNLYSDGQGVPRDFEYAYAWYAVAVAQNHAKATEALPGAKSRLAPEELKEAEKLADKFVKQYIPETDPDKPKEIPAE